MAGQMHLSSRSLHDVERPEKALIWRLNPGRLSKGLLDSVVGNSPLIKRAGPKQLILDLTMSKRDDPRTR